jgi:hypothetical protein
MTADAGCAAPPELLGEANELGLTMVGVPEELGAPSSAPAGSFTDWQHPRFFAYFATSGAQEAILAELLAATLNSVAFLWRTAPAATELEYVVLDWVTPGRSTSSRSRSRSANGSPSSGALAGSRARISPGATWASTGSSPTRSR